MDDPVKTELRFVIDALSPETLSFGRLVVYLNELNKLFGDVPGLHFDCVESGSAQLVAWADEITQPKIRDRLKNISIGSGSSEAMKAESRLNDLLREDNSVGSLNVAGAEIILFPGRTGPLREEIGPISQTTTIEGQLVRIGGVDRTIPFQLIDGERYWKGNVTRTLAKNMAGFLFGPTLRLTGSGVWRRDHGGQWLLDRFQATEFEVLDDTSLNEVLAELRKMIPSSDGMHEKFEDLRGDDRIDDRD